VLGQRVNKIILNQQCPTQMAYRAKNNVTILTRAAL